MEDLIPHLHGICSFAEPCAVDGALIRHLEAKGLRCVYSGDMLIRSSFVLFASHLISASERAELSGERMSTVKAQTRQLFIPATVRQTRLQNNRRRVPAIPDSSNGRRLEW